MRRLGTALAASTFSVAAGIAVAVLPTAPPGAAAATGGAPGPSAITRSAHIAYLSCRAPDVLLTASIQRQPFSTGQPVTFKVSIRDLSRRPCASLSTPPVPANPVNPAAGLLGPCGELSVTVDDSAGALVYPAIAVGCPLILGPSLGAGQTITATGTWDQAAAVGYQSGVRLGPVPRGEYRLVIDDKVTLPVDLVGPPFIPPPATLPPRTNPLPPSPVPAPVQPAPNLPGTTLPSHPVPPSTPPTLPAAPPGHPLTRSAHVAFDGCPAKAVTLTVTIPAGPAPSAPVRYDVTVHNRGNTACGTAFRSGPPAAGRFAVGPCSSMPATFVNALGVDVYPGQAAFFCPLITGPYIAPHATVRATATWPGTEDVATRPGGPSQLRPAPPGAYELVVDNAVEVPFTLIASP
jgi:hypothetical protein